MTEAPPTGPLDEASRRQLLAADPDASTWLSANAGSGKTRVLTDRVARLLMGGTDPERILCLTYTKAAASEMQNRLFKRLGAWAMLDEATMSAELAALGIAALSPERLAEARRLFARAIETPGGLRIQTIHSFCAGLLRRFPLEAGVSPGFTEMDDRAAELLRAQIVEEMAAGGDRGAVDALAGLTGQDDLAPLLAALCHAAGAFEPPLDAPALAALLGLPPGYDDAALRADTLLGGEADLLAAIADAAAGSGTNDQRVAAKLRGIAWDGPLDAILSALEGALLYASGDKKGTAKIGKILTKGLMQGPCAPHLDRLDALTLRIEAARPRRLALANARRSAALHRFAGAFLPRYHAAKAARGWVDFDDLITLTARLLSDRGLAQWVLFRLDGGIDHILVDEAQDTSPGQWQVIERLSEEFTAGVGASDRIRTIFVVGDKKQSIYSFQGADLAAFDRMRAHFGAKFAGIGATLRERALEHSFRSAGAVLQVVDAVFAPRPDQGIGGAPLHIAFHEGLPGRVDLWPPVQKAAEPEDEAWDDPVDLLPEAHHSVVLARRIAGWIKRELEAGTRIPTPKGPRPMRAGDVLILVQRRSALFAEIIAACKTAGLPIAGADRLKLAAELAVKDIRAVLAFLATPEDDLSLAAALRSPLFGWSEDDLHRLAQGRPPGRYLWAQLRGLPEHEATRAILADLRDHADFLRPFELIERLLTRHDGRRRLIARLGAEAEDGIDELLTQALTFESGNIPSLTGFLVWLEGGEVEVKRSPEGAGRAIRVMTVHGAKGLEAPVVILPDTIRREAQGDAAILTIDGHGFWKAAADEAPAPLSAAKGALKARSMEERDRLLYVAMTRAESWLVVCGAGEAKNDGDWWTLVSQGLDGVGAATLATPEGEIRRHAAGDWPAPLPAPDTPDATDAAEALPGWLTRAAAAPAAGPRALSPSDLGGAKVLAGTPGAEALPLDTEAAKRRGRRLHLLLEHLPGWDPAEAADLGWRLLGQGEDPCAPDEVAPLIAEAARILGAPGMAPFLSPAALAEVEFTARLPELGGALVHGAIDRLLVLPGRVVALDYKSNAEVPARPGDTPEGILRQMGAYAAALAQIWPDRAVETAILWTATGILMPLAPEIVRDALRRTPTP
ncbi:double-strand break repair helicase AddA [Frigidibacter sp. MR17.24]|uniref:double-strand break repair helicase AddA n=1 Tax=Frigidibacter sp. MR17.24 TaxID=3127345 RepID=UPI003012DFBF